MKHAKKLVLLTALVSLPSCQDESVLLTPPLPEIESTWVAELQPRTARLCVDIRTHGQDALLQLQWGRTPFAEDLTRLVDVKASAVDPVTECVLLHDLVPETEYFCRWSVLHSGTPQPTETLRFQTLRNTLAPETELQSVRVDTLDGEFLVTVSWSGSDADGVIDHYQWDRSDDALDWVVSSKAGSTFVVDAGVEPAWRLKVRAVDNDGVYDPSPALFILPKEPCPIQFLAQKRSLAAGVQYARCDNSASQGGGFCEARSAHRQAASQDFGAFARSVRASISCPCAQSTFSAQATQNSVLAPDRIRAEGSASCSASDVSSCSSLFDVRFAIAERCFYRLDGEVEGSRFGPFSESVRIELTGATGTISIEPSSSGVPTAFQFIGHLVPGEYRLQAQAQAVTPAGFEGRFELEFSTGP